VRWETKRPFDGQLCHKYVCQKLLKLNKPSSSYGIKIGVFFMPHNVLRVIMVMVVNVAADPSLSILRLMYVRECEMLIMLATFW